MKPAEPLHLQWLGGGFSSALLFVPRGWCEGGEALYVLQTLSQGKPHVPWKTAALHLISASSASCILSYLEGKATVPMPSFVFPLHSVECASRL
jgi:hypothetical protein